MVGLTGCCKGGIAIGARLWAFRSGFSNSQIGCGIIADP
jgi:hypothetical protein